MQLALSAAPRWARALGTFAVLFAAALALHGLVPALQDPDSLYHIRHAWIYRTEGLATSAFPWARFSAIHREASDLWYGFHLLLAPFTFGGEAADGLDAAAVAVPCACLFLFWTASAILGIRRPLLATLAFAAATGDSLFRIAMVRPHPLSLGLALVLFALALEPRVRRLPVFASALLLAWIHLSIVWIGVLLFLAVAVAGLLRARTPPWRWAAASALGFLAGALARPNPLGGIRLAWIQVGTWLAGRGAHVPLEVGRELKPFLWLHFRSEHVPLALILLLAILLVVLERRRGPLVPERAQKVAASFGFLLLFGVMTFAVARRSNDFLVGFVVMFAALAVDGTRTLAPPAPGRLAKFLPVPIAVAMLVAGYRSVDRVRGYSATVPGSGRLREAALWLRDHAREHDLVFNIHWDQFASLFYWNRRCDYVNGNDPVFLYAYDPALFWIAHDLETDAWIRQGGEALVCDGPTPESGRIEGLHAALVRRFDARWVLVQRSRTPRLSAFLAGSPGFSLGFETPGEQVFEVLR